MKKLNRKGFTLIELLAVITIMGILLLVAIPAVSRTIENTRRDTFVDTAKSYINALKTSVSADEVYYVDSENGSVVREPISAADSGYYYYPFTTADNDESATDLMEQGGKSSWGGADVRGYIAVHKTIAGDEEEPTTTTPSGGDDTTTTTPTPTPVKQKTKYEYAIIIVDRNDHGTSTLTVEKSMSRSAISTRVKGGISYEDGSKLKPTGNDYDSFVGTTLNADGENANCKLLEIE